MYSIYSKEKGDNRLQISLKRPYERIGKVIGMSATSVRKIVSRRMHHPETSNAPQPTPSPYLDNFNIGAIR
ncbi:hypothetical protein E2C01_084233 [Portunus trituberculatus]|uniref:Uncharacterized protein n=1 Tax=Portunus trituberculatus TaxID=210409 RepID=A0A5B7JA60_PORTR|nr:hypothetical protein [Portunus trituberculatus]